LLETALETHQSHRKLYAPGVSINLLGGGLVKSVELWNLCAVEA